MAKINDVQVIEKNTGEKIQWEQDGYRLSFDDDALSVKVTKYQGDEARTLDVCMDRGGDLMLGTQPGGRYVAQIEIPAATYTETPIEPQEGADESGEYQPPDRRAHKEPSRHGRGEADPLEH